MSYLNLDQKLSPRYSVRDLCPTSTGIFNTPTVNYFSNLQKMAQALEKLYSQVGPFRIASGYRNPEVNAAAGGSSTSRHIEGDAVDIVPQQGKEAEKFWSQILATPALKNLFGEISYKIHQGSIHLSLPFTNSVGLYVVGSGRTADLENGKAVYHSLSSAQINEYLAKNGFITAPATASILPAGISSTSLGLGVVGVGAGALLLVLALRKK